MIISEVQYIGSYPDVKLCPKDPNPCFAFMGRSNVGKSSLINMLCQRKEIAKISNSPGKTQTINYFLVNHSWYLVDLPGYGYAKVSKTKRVKWKKMIEKYILGCSTLVWSFALIDVRHPMQEIDLDFVNWLGKNEIPFSMIFTKSDKINSKSIEIHKNQINSELAKFWNELPAQFVSSSRIGHGKLEILGFIEELITEYKNAIREIK